MAFTLFLAYIPQWRGEARPVMWSHCVESMSKENTICPHHEFPRHSHNMCHCPQNQTLRKIPRSWNRLIRHGLTTRFTTLMMFHRHPGKRWRLTVFSTAIWVTNSFISPAFAIWPFPAKRFTGNSLVDAGSLGLNGDGRVVALGDFDGDQLYILSFCSYRIAESLEVWMSSFWVLTSKHCRSIIGNTVRRLFQLRCGPCI